MGPDDQLLAVLGDVSGRGARAAATTAALRWTIRGLTSVIHEPAALLRKVADAVHDALDERCPTVAVVRLPTSPGDADADAVLALAGHPQPVLLPAEGPGRLVGRPGLLLGPFASVELFDELVSMGSEDYLVLYTDGVTEATSPEHELLGDEGLLAALEAPALELPRLLRLPMRSSTL